MPIRINKGYVLFSVFPDHPPSELAFHHRTEVLSAADHGNAVLDSQRGIYHIALFRVIQQCVILIFAPGGNLSWGEGGAVGMTPLLGNGYTKLSAHRIA